MPLFNNQILMLQIMTFFSRITSIIIDYEHNFQLTHRPNEQILIDLVNILIRAINFGRTTNHHFMEFNINNYILFTFFFLGRFTCLSNVFLLIITHYY